ncbi:hypothetical protein K505DRAFT_372646 [Melanomma pulvis-pyrius CBS 109.77]|uniref:UBA domain-containing protein n=1 Tax=Melanomma pulvis-pyrius CBS 109.77 TaxID=1314802 RepID=A0A6A6XKX4_9PLEO|nr:hypothetical protein K505DRAFT_372646 [Melanomma pulvis-pyrius CBS 109.77]
MRVIRDSDDEFDEEDLEGETAASKGKDASPNNLNTSLPVPGTGSTDSLKRTIEAAHHALFQSPPMLSLPTAAPPQEPSSSAGHRSKRRKTAGASLDLSPGMGSERKKEPKSYGRSKSIFSSAYLDHNQEKGIMRESEDGRVELPFSKLSCEPVTSSIVSLTGVTGAVHYGNTDADAVPEKLWNLEGTLRDSYAAHEPMAMFPEPSSTIPNATLTQQRLLDEVMNPAFLGIEPEIDAPPYEPAKSSVPWSDFLNTPSGNTETQDAHHLAPSPPIAQGLPPAHTSNEVSISQHTECNSSLLPKGSPSQNCMLSNGIDPKDIMKTPLVLSQENRSGNAVVTSLFNDNISLSNKGPPTEERRQSPRRRDERQKKNTSTSPEPNPKQKSRSLLNSEDEFMVIGIPKEQYNARPSRSRSLKMDIIHPVDYSIRPERASKRGIRRSKTTNGAEQDPSTPQKVQRICDMGFTPGTTQRALKENHGNVSQTVDWLITNGAAVEEDELAPPRQSTSKPKTKRNNTKSNTSSHSVGPMKEDATSPQDKDRRTSFSGTAVADISHDSIPKECTTEIDLIDKPPQVPESKSPRVQVVIHSKGSPNRTEVNEQQTKANISQKIDIIDAPTRKPKRRKTTLDQPEPIEEHVVTLTTPTMEKKRGRGRPRKEIIPPISNETILEDEEETQGEPTSAETPISRGVDTQTKATTPHVTEPPTSTPTSKMTTKESSGTPETLPKPTNGSHSPLNKGKVPYRVGLSKRARIAPLLRVLKK